MQRLIATTTYKPTPASEARAQEVAERCGLIWVPRTDSVTRLIRGQGAEGAYVVGPGRVELRDLERRRIAVHAGTYPLVAKFGREHPLVRAVAPLDEPPPARVIDATLGLAKDAIHLAGILGCEVVGLERVRLLVCLAEDGLARLAGEGAAWSAGAARVRVEEADAREWFGRQPAASAEVVYLDPMFPRPAAAHQGWPVLRAIAWPEPLDAGLLAEARRVASRRVVLKVPAGADPREYAPLPALWTRVEGRKLDWLVCASDQA